MRELIISMWYQTGPLIKHKLAVPPQGRSTIRAIADDVKPTPRQLSAMKSIADPLNLAPRTPEEMIKELQRRYGSVLRAMRSVYDIRNGRLTFRDFCISYERLGYSQQVRSVWFLLDKNLSGDISLEELDPQAFGLLKRFHTVMVQKYGSLASAWRHCLDCEGREVVPFRIFLQTMQNELGVTYEEAELLFKCLDLDSLGTISYDEIVFLNDWEQAERKFAKKRRERWVNRDPAGIIDWENRPALDVGSPPPKRTSAIPQVGYEIGEVKVTLPATTSLSARIEASGSKSGAQTARSFSLSPRGPKMGRTSRQQSKHNKTKAHLPAIK